MYHRLSNKQIATHRFYNCLIGASYKCIVHPSLPCRGQKAPATTDRYAFLKYWGEKQLFIKIT